eukprot:SAG31_NODE_777_length_12167_cov_6.570683_7_plen_168_part_00
MHLCSDDVGAHLDDPNEGKDKTNEAGDSSDQSTVKRVLAAQSYEEMVAWMKALEDFTADPAEAMARRAEEQRRREEETAAEEEERAQLEAAKLRRQEELDEHQEQLAEQAKADTIARERAAKNRQVCASDGTEHIKAHRSENPSRVLLLALTWIDTKCICVNRRQRS